MKSSSLLLVGSLVINVAAGIGLVAVNKSVDQRSPELAQATARADGTNPGEARPAIAGGGETKGTTWVRLESSDLKTLIARLRAADFPPSLIRAMVTEQLRAQFADRRQAIMGQAAPFEYWKPGGIYNNGYATDPKTRAALRDLSREQTNQVKELLGDDATDEDLSSDWRRRQYGKLTKEKVDQINQVTQDYSDLESQIRNAANGMMLKEDRDKLAYLAEEKKKDLAGILTPEEAADYDLHSSQTTNRLRYQLSNVDLTEDQFRAIYQIQKPFDDKYAPSGMISAEMAKERTEAQKEIQANIKAALGEPLATQYEQAMDTNYQAASRVVGRLNLPKETVQEVMDVQKDIQARATALRENHDLTREQREAQLSALGAEATTKLTTAFQSERNLSIYRDNGGYWLNNLTPPPARR